MKLKPETVAGTVKVWDIMFPGKRTESDLALLSTKMFKRFSAMYSDEAFKVAAEKVEDECQFFPTIKNVIDVANDAYAEIAARRSSNHLALPEKSEVDLTPEEIAINEDRLEVVRKAIRGEISYKDAEKILNEMIGFAAKVDVMKL